jgi:hypothetical protein
MAVSFKENKRRILGDEPAKGREGNTTVGTDYNDPSQTVSNSGKTPPASRWSDTVLRDQMAAVNAKTDSISV